MCVYTSLCTNMVQLTLLTLTYLQTLLSTYTVLTYIALTDESQLSNRNSNLQAASGDAKCSRQGRSTSATKLRRSLHCLPVRQRVDYRLELIDFQRTTHWLPGLHSISA